MFPSAKEEDARGLLAASQWPRAVRHLPQPMHLLEFAVRSRHYHMGLFERATDDLVLAQDHVVDRALRGLAGAEFVLDIGCGLGGTSRRLAAHGHMVTAIDRCAESIAFARALDGAAARQPTYARSSLEAFAREPAAFDGAVAIEVLQHFPALDVFFAACTAVLRPGGRLIVHDLRIDVEVEWQHAPFHRHGQLCRVAMATGHEVLEHVDLTDQVTPTFRAFTRALARRRRATFAFFKGREGGVERLHAELRQLERHILDLERAFAAGHLRYEATTLRRRP